MGLIANRHNGWHMNNNSKHYKCRWATDTGVYYNHLFPERHMGSIERNDFRIQQQIIPTKYLINKGVCVHEEDKHHVELSQPQF